jgi:hypothetical protein
MLQLMLYLTLQPMPRQTPWPTPLETSATTQLTMPTFRETPSQTQDKMQELNLLQYKVTAQKEANVNV